MASNDSSWELRMGSVDRSLEASAQWMEASVTFEAAACSAARVSSDWEMSIRVMLWPSLASSTAVGSVSDLRSFYS